MGQGLGNIIEGVGAGLSQGFESMMDYSSKVAMPTTKLTDEQVNNPKETSQGNAPRATYSGQMLSELKKERDMLLKKIESIEKSGKKADAETKRFYELNDIIANSETQ